MANMLPAVFFGHGNPMNAITHNDYTGTWRRMGALRSLKGPQGGIDQATAFAFAAADVAVLIGDVDPRAESTVREIVASDGGSACQKTPEIVASGGESAC